jgi:hypothetical protein
MKVRWLTICTWNDGARTDTAVDTPSWADVEAAVRALNNRNLSDIHLELAGPPEAFLSVGGGAGRYIVSGSVDGRVFPVLIDASLPEDPRVDLVVGGQLGDYPRCCAVDLDHALRAVRSVAETGEFQQGLGWANC